MPFLLPLASILTVAITMKTLEKTSKKMQKRKNRKLKNGI